MVSFEQLSWVMFLQVYGVAILVPKILGMECPVCLGIFNASDKVPHVLQCGHTFCSYCIGRIVSLARVGLGRKRIECPTCRFSTRISHVRVNFALRDVLTACYHDGSSSSSDEEYTHTEELRGSEVYLVACTSYLSAYMGTCALCLTPPCQHVVLASQFVQNWVSLLFITPVAVMGASVVPGIGSVCGLVASPLMLLLPSQGGAKQHYDRVAMWLATVVCTSLPFSVWWQKSSRRESLKAMSCRYLVSVVQAFLIGLSLGLSKMGGCQGCLNSKVLPGFGMVH